VLTKAEFEVFNQNEVKLSGLRRCICCWDQEWFSDYVRHAGIPNYFLLERLGTDKGQARIDGVASTECDYFETCGVAPRRPEIADFAMVTELWPPYNFSRDTALLGLATKRLVFEGATEAVERAGMNLVGTGEQVTAVELNGTVDRALLPAIVLRGSTICYDIPRGTDESHQAVPVPTRGTESLKDKIDRNPVRGGKRSW
jgi:hypothetical protein